MSSAATSRTIGTSRGTLLDEVLTSLTVVSFTRTNVSLITYVNKRLSGRPSRPPTPRPRPSAGVAGIEPSIERGHDKRCCG